MYKVNFKPLALSLIISLTGVMQLPLSAWAATDQAAQAAAQKGLDYLTASQQSNGSISGSSGATDWSVVALEAGRKDTASLRAGGASAIDYLKTDVPSATAPSTDVERKIIAIAAAGQDVKNFGGTNYVNRLLTYHTDHQIGNPTYLNDDIFGIIAAAASGQADLKSTAQDGLDYLLSYQKADGGFTYTTAPCGYFYGNPNNNPLTDPCDYDNTSDSNDTAAAIVAMYAAEQLGLTNSNLTSALNHAVTYLLSTQQSADGGFGYDGYGPSDYNSTAWALMALHTIGGSVQAQALQARDYLLLHQNADGSYDGYFGEDTTTTAHVAIALLGTTWLLRPAPLMPVTPSPVQPAGSDSQPVPAVAPSTSSIVTNASPAASKKLIVTSSSSGDTGLIAANTAPAADDTQSPVPQVKAATITAQPENKTAAPAVAKTSKINHAAIYGVAVLVLVASGWFVLESRQKQRG